MSVAILVPVLGRPHRIAALVANIAETTPGAHVLFCASDEPTFQELRRVKAAFLLDDGGTYPERINRMFRVTESDYVFLGADDILFHPGWLEAGLRYCQEGFGVVAVNDLHNPNGTHCLVAREYITSRWPRDVLHEGYRHNYCDTELFGIARARGEYAYCPGSVVEHLHPAAGKGEQDATYAQGGLSFEADRELFLSREPLWAV